MSGLKAFCLGISLGICGNMVVGQSFEMCIILLLFLGYVVP